jgi:hypothetical protein
LATDDLIGINSKGHQPLRQGLLVRKIGNPQAFALYNRAPLLDLILPGARYEGKENTKRMRRVVFMSWRDVALRS